MADLTIQKIDQTGIAPSFVAADAGGDTFSNDGRTFLHVKNGGGSAITVTIDSVAPCNYGFDHDLQVTVNAGAEQIIGPFEPKRFNTDGKVSVSYSDVTSVTVAAFRL
jgi:hypothetical protein